MTSADQYPRRVICAFYASPNYGSEYRAGFEFIRFAASIGFDLAIIADLEENARDLKSASEVGGIQVVRIPSIIKSQRTLYKYTDVAAQWLWHLRVGRWIKEKNIHLHTLWIQNGASPWLPLTHYFGLSDFLIWGPVGGGESASVSMMQTLPWRDRVRERLRSKVEGFVLRRNLKGVLDRGAPRMVVMARTREAQSMLSEYLGYKVPVIPEILDPVKAVSIRRNPSTSPRLVWVGQDVPRKNLRLALQLFKYLRERAFPQATLEVFGCKSPHGQLPDGVTFHGWVSKVPWDQFQNSGVLLMTSFREGLPSSVLEAAGNGLLCVTSDVGAIGSLGLPTVHLLPKEEYPNYTDASLRDVAHRIKKYLAQTEIRFETVSNQDELRHYLQVSGTIK